MGLVPERAWVFANLGPGTYTISVRVDNWP